MNLFREELFRLGDLIHAGFLRVDTKFFETRTDITEIKAILMGLTSYQPSHQMKNEGVRIESKRDFEIHYGNGTIFIKPQSSSMIREPSATRITSLQKIEEAEALNVQQTQPRMP